MLLWWASAIIFVLWLTLFVTISSFIQTLLKENKSLREQRTDLLNRLMSPDIKTFKSLTMGRQIPNSDSEGKVVYVPVQIEEETGGYNEEREALLRDLEGLAPIDERTIPG